MTGVKKSVIVSKAFKKDLKRLVRRGVNFTEFDIVIRHLEKGENIPYRYHPHPLKGNLSGYNECHIETDLLLIWKEDDKAIYLVRTGSHSDLFKR